MDFLEQDAIGHELDSGLFGHVSLVSDLIGDDPVGTGYGSVPQSCNCLGLEPCGHSKVGRGAGLALLGRRPRGGPTGSPSKARTQAHPASLSRSCHGQVKSTSIKHTHGPWLEPDVNKQL